jgi:DNA primase
MVRYDRDAVLAAIDLADVLTRELGPPKQLGSDWWWPSVDPAMVGTGHTPPTHIIPASRTRCGVAMFKDFASGRSGTAIDVLMLNRGITFTDALTALAAEHGITPAAGPSRQRPEHRAARPSPGAPPEPDRPPPAAMIAWIHDCADRLATSHTRGAATARAWLRQRGYTDRLLADNLVGYDPGSRHDPTRPRHHRQTVGIPNLTGVTLPHFDIAGQIIYVQTRSLTWTPDRPYPKYVNPTGITNPRFGLWADPDTHHKAGAPVLITEGPTDSLTARQAGYDVAGLIGAAHAHDPETTTALITTLGSDRPYIILTDPDPAGRTAAHHLVTNLQALGAVATHLPPPDGNDLTAWAATTQTTFTTALHAHVRLALTDATLATRRALAGDADLPDRSAAIREARSRTPRPTAISRNADVRQALGPPRVADDKWLDSPIQPPMRMPR